MDIAPLGFYVDTTGLITGQKAVDDFTVKVGKAGEAVDKLGNESQASGKQAEAAATGFKKAGDAAQDAANKTERMAGANDKATSGSMRLTDRLKSMMGMLGTTGAASEQTSGNIKKLEGFLSNAGTQADRMAVMLGIGGRGGLTGSMIGAAGAGGTFNRTLVTMSSRLGPIGAAIGVLIAGFATLQKSLSDNEDRWNQYRQRLGVALKDFDAAADSVQRLSMMANEVGVSMETVMRSFQRFANVRTSLGATTEELEQMTEAIVKIGQVSGTSQGEMQGAMLQLSQALASGRLNGDELRSIMESMQPLLQEIAAGMGVSTGELRKMGAEGELTSQKIFDAIMSRIDDIDERYEQLDGTVERSQARMGNAWDKLLANFGETIGASKTIQAAFDGIAAAIEGIDNFLFDEGPSGEALLNKQIEAYEKILERQKAANYGPAVLAQTEARIDDLYAQRELLVVEEARKEQQERIVGLQEKLGRAVRNGTSEYLKQENQLTKLKTAEQEYGDYIIDAQNLRAAALSKVKQATEEITEKQRELGVMRRLAAGGNEGAQEIVNRLEGELRDAELLLEEAERAERVNIAVREQIRKRLEDVESGGASKIRREVEALNAALAESGGGFVRLAQQAQQMFERLPLDNQTPDGRSAIMAALLSQVDANANQAISNMENAARVQRDLADAMAGGEFSAEIAAEAATWAFQQYGDVTKQNTEIVQRYTDALRDLKMAQQAVADASESKALTEQIERLQTDLANVGGGTYAQRRAQSELGIQQFLRDRAGMRETVESGTTIEQTIATIRRLFPGATITSTTRPGARTSSGGVSDHAVGRAIDFVPAGGMGSMDPAEVRRMLLEAGVPIRTSSKGEQFLGPGQFNKDGKHGDHYHLGLDTAGGGTSQAQMSNFDEATQRIVAQRQQVFELEEQLRRAQLLEENQLRVREDMRRMDVIGNQNAERELELELEIERVTQGMEETEARRLASSMRAADAVKQELEARRQIEGMRQANDDRSRQIGAMGDPAAERALRLQLEIERIRKTLPENQQQNAIDQARASFQLDNDEIAARARVDREDRARSINQQIELLGFVGEELEVQQILMQRQNELRQAGIEIGSEFYEQQMELEEVFARQEVKVRRQLETQQAIKNAYLQAADEIGRGFSEMFSYAFREGEIKANFALRAIELAFYNMLDRLVQQLVISPLVDLIGQVFGMAFGSIFPGLPGLGASPGGGGGGGGGGAGYGSGRWGFANGGVIPAASGMIMNAPTRLKGGSVLAGEGPSMYEALLPLKRGPDGRLGVAMTGGWGSGGGGGGVEVNIIDQRGTQDSESVQVQERQSGNGMRQIEVLIRDSVRSNIRSGSFDGDNKAAYGLGRTVQRR